MVQLLWFGFWMVGGISLIGAGIRNFGETPVTPPDQGPVVMGIIFLVLGAFLVRVSFLAFTVRE